MMVLSGTFVLGWICLIASQLMQGSARFATVPSILRPQPDLGRLMSGLWSNSLVTTGIGFFVGLLANRITVYWARFQSYQVARRLGGKWSAHNMADGRHVDRRPMHDKPTSIKPRPWYRACCSDSHILDVSAEDPDGRQHGGPLVIDPLCPWLATRIVLYFAMDEASEQRIIISPDWSALYVFPVAAASTLGSGYKVHALCKVRSEVTGARAETGTAR